MNINEQEITRALSILKPDGELVEIRIICSSGKLNFSGYFTDSNMIIQKLKQLQVTENCNVYFTLNQIAPACYSREQRDTFIRNAKNSTGDRDITAYNLLMIDFDPERPAGTSATDAELEIAHQRAAKVYKYLRGKQWAEPIIALSGNGYHLLYKLNMPNTEQAKALIKKVLETFNYLFGDNELKIDTSVFNPARICKLYGTVAEKGAHTDERPHRYAKIIKAPDPFTEVTPEQLTAITKELPEQEQPPRPASYNGDKFNLDRWIAEHGINVTSVSNYGNGGTKYILANCAFDPSHTGKDACIIQLPNGAIAYKCLHDSCSGYRWQDFRKLYEPEYDPNASYRLPDVPRRAQNSPQSDFYPQHDSGTATSQKHEIGAFEGKPDNITHYIDTMMQADIANFRSDIKTGFSEFDRKTGGLYSGLYVLAAIPSLGKTSFMIQIADRLAQSGHDVIFFSLEQSRLEMVSKGIARRIAQKYPDTDITSLHIRKGNNAQIVQDATRQFKQQVSDRLSIIEGNFNCDVEYIGNYITQYIDATGSKPIVFIDYLQILQPADDRQSTKETVDYNIVELKRLTRNLNITIIAAASVNRTNYMTPIDFESLKESGNIEFSADVILGMQLYCLNEDLFNASEKVKVKQKRERINEAKAESPRDIELKCLKNRFGISTFSCRYKYYCANDLFMEVTDDFDNPFVDDDAIVL